MQYDFCFKYFFDFFIYGSAFYYAAPLRFRWLVLLVVSIVFYALSGPAEIIFILAASIITYLAGRWIERIYEKQKELLKEPGLAYYTFFMIGYLCDIYWKKGKAEKNYFRFLLFAIYFPKILQGPISSYKNLGPQLEEEHVHYHCLVCV